MAAWHIIKYKDGDPRWDAIEELLEKLSEQRGFDVKAPDALAEAAKQLLKKVKEDL